MDIAGNQTNLLIRFHLYKKIIFLSLTVGEKTAIVNQKPIFLDFPPQIIQGRTLVPIRFIADGFGAKVEWKAATKEILIQLDNHILELQISNKKAKLDKKQTIYLDVPPQIIQGRTLVPIRFIADGFGAKVEWKAATKEILIQYFQSY